MFFRLESKSNLLTKLSMSQGNLSLFLRPSINDMKLTYIMEGHLLYSKSTDLDVNLI